MRQFAPGGGGAGGGLQAVQVGDGQRQRGQPEKAARD